MKRILALTSLLFLTALTHAQAGFQATANSGSLSNHQDCSTTPCTVVDTRISTSSASGFTSPAQVTFVHFSGKDFNASPDNGVIEFGQFQLGTGSFLSGSLASTALFDVDQSYVTIGTNGSCGQFNAAGTCKPGGFLPNTATMFVGVFVGRISWSTNADNSHVLMGTVRGFVNGGTTQVFLNLTATTAADSNPFASNGWLNIATVTIAPF
jgi:hypothetical protein